MAGMSDEALLGAVDADGVRTLTLNRPDKANALNARIVERALELLAAIGDETRLLVVTGAGRNFCGGFDFAGHEQQSEGDLLLRFVRINDLLTTLRRASYATVAWVNGAAFGAGADIACSCTVRFGAPRARFRFPGFRFGVALGTRRLVEVIGSQRAREVLACNEEIDAEQAHRDGLLGAVIDEAAVAARVADLARSMRGLDPAARSTLLAISGAASEDADLADLVRSVARPGIHARIARYRQATA